MPISDQNKKLIQHIFSASRFLILSFKKPTRVHLAKEALGWRGWIPQFPEVECKAKTKKELVNTLAIRLREALQAREDAWDKQLEADIAAGKLEHLREDTSRAKKAGKLTVADD